MIIDTTILVDLSRGNELVAHWLQEKTKDSVPAVSAVSVMELLFGVRNKSELDAISELVNLFQPLPITEEITEVALGLMKSYVLSHRLSIPDALIAATALVQNLPLATSNKKHFEMIPHLRLIVPSQ